MGLIIGRENSFDIEELIYNTGDSIESISLVLTGSVRTESETFGVAKFIGLKDLAKGSYSCDYYAAAGTKLMVFPVDDIYSLLDFFEANPAIHGRFYFPLCHIMEHLYTKYMALFRCAQALYSLITDTHEKYVRLCESFSISPAVYNISHGASLFKYEDQGFCQNYNVFLTCYKTPEKLKMIYDKHPENFMKQQIATTNSLCTTYEDMAFYVKGLFSSFVSRSQDCLFNLVSSLASMITKSESEAVMELLTDMKNKLTIISNQLEKTVEEKYDIDFKRADHYITMAANATPKNEPSDFDLTLDAQSVMDESNDSEILPDFSDNLGAVLDFIDEPEDSKRYSSDLDLSGQLLNLCEYVCAEPSFYENFNKHVEFYISMSDKSSREDDARTFRREITALYYELYEKVFFKMADDNTPPLFAKIFIDFGLVDDRLLTAEQTDLITQIPPLQNCKPCKVWRMSEWLMAIYKGEKMPSKNEFDKDYIEFVREKKRELHLTPQQEAAMLEDRHAKVKFEIVNVVKYNGRILSGNMLAFQPMLSKFDFEGDFKNFILDSAAINNALNDILTIDYSVFYREQMYTNPEKKIDKEVIQLQVFPDFVLFPVYGINGIMWQDLSGKRSNTPGRFFLPSFFRGNITDTLISLLGRFRWELCKSITGTAWNNVLVPSLTAEYSDYIQFYRKNRDLSAEKKEALKNQLSRCRNNMREVFISDYSTWIKFEANGAVRLNKVSRQILATYCPFAKEIRAKLKGQPLYDDAMKKFEINHQKKINEIQTRMRALDRAGAEITQEIFDTQAFYEL